MKYIKILILAILVISCEQNKHNEFTLNIKVNGKYEGYLYLNYNEIKDSCLIKDGKAIFTGTVSNPTLAYYSTNYISANDKNFYLENENIYSEITIAKRKIKEYNIDWISTDTISDTKTSIIEKDFEDFKLKFSSDKDWQKKLYEKVKKIIEQNPKNMYSGDLLAENSNDTILSKEQIGDLYNMLNIELQSPLSIQRIEFKAFPQYKNKKRRFNS